MIKPQIEEKEKIIDVVETPITGELSTSEKNDVSEINPEDLENIVPQMNVAMPLDNTKDIQQLITDDQYLEILSNILTDIKEDRKQVSDYIDNFADMVMNDGDATTSSKEALVNLVKIKTDLQDKMLKAADLMTRLKIKNTYAYSGPHLNALQQNNFNIGSDTSFDRKELIKAINQAKKKKKE